MHAVVVAGLTTAVCLILYVIAVLDYPFNSGVSVQPDAFEPVLRAISRVTADHTRTRADDGRPLAPLPYIFVKNATGCFKGLALWYRSDVDSLQERTDE
jgi:hypothetical protein